MVGTGTCAAEDQLARLRRCDVPPKLVMTANETEKRLIRQPGQQLVLREKPVRFWHRGRLCRTRRQRKVPTSRADTASGRRYRLTSVAAMQRERSLEDGRYVHSFCFNAAIEPASP